jgi:DNA polymerase III subunit epsilon
MTTPASLLPPVFDDENRGVAAEASDARLAPTGHPSAPTPPDDGGSLYTYKGFEKATKDAVAFVACATSGPDPERHEVLEVAVVLADSRHLDWRHETTVRFRPERLSDAEPRSLAACGYSDQEWERADEPAEALKRIRPWLECPVLGGHQVFDTYARLGAAYLKAGVRAPRAPRHVLDTASLGWPLYTLGLVRSVSLDEIANFVGEKARGLEPARHDVLRTPTLDDARLARQVAARLAHGGELVAVAESLSPELQLEAKSYLLRLAKRSREPSAGLREYDDYFTLAILELLGAMQTVGSEASRVLHRHKLEAQRPRQERTRGRRS